MAETSDAYGGRVESYTDVASAWASIQQINSYQENIGVKPTAMAVYRIVTRWMPSWYAYWDFLNGLAAITSGEHVKNPAMRFKYRNRYFKILNVMDIGENHRWFEFYCEETA
jgi:head-tail adaptor